MQTQSGSVQLLAHEVFHEGSFKLRKGSIALNQSLSIQAARRSEQTDVVQVYLEGVLVLIARKRNTWFCDTPDSESETRVAKPLSGLFVSACASPFPDS